jgi:hypothetical protein
MQAFRLTVFFNDDDTFRGVFAAGKYYELQEWNNIFQALDPQNQNAGTNVSKEAIDTEYDPD